MSSCAAAHFTVPWQAKPYKGYACIACLRCTFLHTSVLVTVLGRLPLLSSPGLQCSGSGAAVRPGVGLTCSLQAQAASWPGGGMKSGGLSSSAKRIQKELAEISLDPPCNCSAGPKGDNIYEWVSTIMGPGSAHCAPALRLCAAN